MTGEVIKSFLVGLGFDISDAELAKFNKAIASATLKVAALYGSIQLTAAGILYGLTKISEGFEQMGYEYRIISPMINKALVLRRELLKAYEAAGINIVKVVKQSVLLNLSLTKTKFALKAIYESVASRFFPLITKQSELFREKLYKNMPGILNALERMVKFIFKAFEATVTLGERLFSILSRVYDFFVQLDKATDGWSTIILGVIAAWKLLNLSFLATPLGLIITGLVAILALFDDFETWKEGGQSLFDWSYAVPIIDAIGDGLTWLKGLFLDIFDAVGNVVLALYQFSQGDFSGALDSLKESAASVYKYFSAIYDVIKKFLDVSIVPAVQNIASFLTNSFKDALGFPSANVANNPVGGGVSPTPLGANATNNQTNQNVNQQTQINVSGVADAGLVGKAVAGEQNRVNFDMVRNLKGATR